MSARRAIWQARLRERLAYGLGVLKGPLALIIFATGRVLVASGFPTAQTRGARLLLRLHTAAIFTRVDAWIAAWVRHAAQAERQGLPTALSRFCDHVVRQAVASFLAGPNPDPARLIGSRILVVKSARPGERGVLVVDYQYVFPLLAGLFDLPAIAERYDIVLEPSWAGACCPEILLFSRLRHPVYVQTIEPRDHEFLTSIHTNVKIVPLAANWWADPAGVPDPKGVRDIDVIMVAAWADIKRHWRVFKALAALRRRGHRLKIVLVGYRYDRTRQDIEELAEYFGIRDQVETYERITQEQVSALLARSKVHVLWSRRECANRAIIEAMMADVPVIIREGLTFGFRYPYINEHTGRFVPEHGLGGSILEMIANKDRYSPREWVLHNMTCGKATAVLETYLHERADTEGSPWTEQLAAKSSTLDTQRYLTSSDRERFAEDYEFLRTVIRG